MIGRLSTRAASRTTGWSSVNGCTSTNFNADGFQTATLVKVLS